MRAIDLSYIVNSINMDAEFPLKEMVIEFRLSKQEYRQLLTEINTLVYKINEVVDPLPKMFEVSMGNVNFRIINGL